MRFGGHETFHIRDGWMHKALKMAMEEPGELSAPTAADRLGVGENMVKALRHWLVATSLAERSVSSRDGRKVTYEFKATPIGEKIWQHDPHFTDLSTWWALHINLINSPDHAASWDWFFNVFGQPRFEKGVALEALHRFLKQTTKQRPPADRTLERDVGVLLNSYSTNIPAPTNDPEDSKECPLNELGLITHFKDSGLFRINFGKKPISASILGYALSKRHHDTNAEMPSISVTDASVAMASPGRCFCMRTDDIFDLVCDAAEKIGDDYFQIQGMAGNRMIRFRKLAPEKWLEKHYMDSDQPQSSDCIAQVSSLLKTNGN